MRDALKNYLALANGLTEVTKQQAKAAAKALVKQGEATRGQVDRISEELVATSRANRAIIVSIVRTEVDKTLGKLGLATAEEVARLTRRLQDLENALRSAAVDDAPKAAPAAAAAPAEAAVVKKAPAAKKAAVKPAKPAAAATKPAKSAAKKTIPADAGGTP